MAGPEQILIGHEYGRRLSHLVDPEKRRSGLARWFPRVAVALRISSVILALVVLFNVTQMALFW